MPAPVYFRTFALAAATMLLAPTAWAQHTNVVVDWSALDALGPAAAPASGAVALRPPPKRPVVAAPAAPAPPASANGVAASKPALPPAKIALAAPPRPTPPPPAAEAAPPQAAPSAIPASAPALLPGRATMVRFARGRSEISAEGRDLLNQVATQLAANGKLRLQLVGYASGSGDDAVEARRLSLQRAVQMRGYLIEKGVPSVRIDVRALGSVNGGSVNGGSEAPDRVDLVIIEPR